MTNINDMEKPNHHKPSKLHKTFKNVGVILKNIFSSRLFLAMLFLLIGSMATYSCTNKDHKKHSRYHHYSFFEDEDDDFHDDFFAEFEAMHRSMERAMKRQRQMMEQAFKEMNDDDKDRKNFSRVQASLNHYQDEKFHNFELNFSGIKPEDISVVVEKNYLIFSSKKAEISATKDDGKALQATSSADFYYATYLPEYDDKIAPEIIKNNDKISVKLAKKIREKTGVKNPEKNGENNIKKTSPKINKT